MIRAESSVKSRPRWGMGLAWGYASLVVLSAILLWSTGDRWWFGTMLCFGPRWVLVIPLPFLALFARRNWRTQGPPLLLAALVLPFWMGVSFRLGTFSPNDGSMPFRIVTFNTQGDKQQDLAAFSNWVLPRKPDVMIFQECDEDHIAEAFDKHWHWARADHDLVLASRHRIVSAIPIDHSGRPERYRCMCVELEVEGRVVRIGCVHLPTPREGLQRLVQGDLHFVGAMAVERRGRAEISQLASRFLMAECRADVLAGDFNLPVESGIFRDHWGEATDAFSAAGFGLGNTKFTRWHGVRIDHVLVANPNIKTMSAVVGPDVGSDHRPLLVELALPIASSR